jgi:hypothetical protein
MSDNQVIQNSGPFRAGDRVQLTGPKGRMNTITLEPGTRTGGSSRTTTSSACRTARW